MQAVLHQCVKVSTSDGNTHDGKCQCNWVQDHRVGQSIRASSGDLREASAIDLFHNVRWLISHRLGEAIVLIGLGRSNIENAVAEGTKGHTGMSDVGRVGEGNLEDTNVSNYGRRDGGDEKESGRNDEEGNADPVESASHSDEVVQVVEETIWMASWSECSPL